MAGTLFIRFHPDTASDPSWYWRDPGSETAARSGEGLDTIDSALARGKRTVVLVPGTEVLLTQAEVPTRNRQRLLKAVPYALEEQLVEDVDTLHFALGPGGAGASTSVAVVARQRMEQWLDQLRSQGIEPHVVIPDVLALPAPDNQWCLLLDGDLAILRTGRTQGLAVEPNNLSTVLALLLAETDENPPQGLHVFDCRDQPSQDAGSILPETISATRQPCNESTLATLARSYSEHTGLNLLQGPYSRREQLSKLLRPWRPAAALLVAWIGLQLVVDVIDYQRMHREATQLQARIDRIFLETVPDAGKATKARARMERYLEQLQGGSERKHAGFLELLSRIGGVVNNTDQLELEAVNFQDGHLDLQITIGDLQGLDTLKRNMEAQALEVEIQSATARDRGVSGRLRITGTGSTT